MRSCFTRLRQSALLWWLQNSPNNTRVSLGEYSTMETPGGTNPHTHTRTQAAFPSSNVMLVLSWEGGQLPSLLYQKKHSPSFFQVSNSSAQPCGPGKGNPSQVSGKTSTAACGAATTSKPVVSMDRAAAILGPRVVSLGKIRKATTELPEVG